jgi:hypothetical protein
MKQEQNNDVINQNENKCPIDIDVQDLFQVTLGIC